MFLSPIPKAATILTTLSLLITPAWALTISSWDMTDQLGDQTTTTGLGSTMVAANAMTRGAGLGLDSGGNSMNSKGWDGTNSNDYFQFGFTVAAGFTSTLDQLFIRTRSSDTGPGTLGVYTSLDGYTAPVHTLVQSGDSYLSSSIDLSGLGPIMGSFAIRLIEIGDTQADGKRATQSIGTFRITNYNGTSSPTRITGSTNAVPDGGSSLPLMILGLSTLTFAGRRFKRT